MGAYEVKVAKIPDCDLAGRGGAHDEPIPAVYDGATKMGPWAYMCSDCFRNFGVGLGIGRGQKLILASADVKADHCGNDNPHKPHSMGGKVWCSGTALVDADPPLTD
jgi:hypothetical protein